MKTPTASQTTPYTPAPYYTERVNVPYTDGRPGTESICLCVRKGETREESGFGVGKYTIRHDIVSLEDGTEIGRIQIRCKKGRTESLTSLNGANVCVQGEDHQWLAREWRERNGGLEKRRTRIQPGTKYRVPHDFGIGPRALTSRGLGYVPTGATLEVTAAGPDFIEFKWTGYPGSKLPSGPDSLVRSSFETMVDTFSFREYL